MRNHGNRVLALVALACISICAFVTLPLLVSASQTKKTNENGQTYGTIMDATSMVDCADLLAAIGEDGTEGFVLASDLWGESPSSPEEALAKNKEAWKSREIPLYSSDGKEVIGKFIVTPPQRVSETQEDGTTIDHYPDGTVITTSADGTVTFSIEER